VEKNNIPSRYYILDKKSGTNAIISAKMRAHCFREKKLRLSAKSRDSLKKVDTLSKKLIFSQKVETFSKKLRLLRRLPIPLKIHLEFQGEFKVNFKGNRKKIFRVSMKFGTHL
jgi:hypothetical protein